MNVITPLFSLIFGNVLDSGHLKTPNGHDVITSSMLNCGIRSSFSEGFLQPRIVGGSEALLGEFPWQVSLQKFQFIPTPHWKHFCAGSIVKENWILTAAHCVDRYVSSPEEIRAVSGVVDWDSLPFEKYSISKVVVHQDWNRLEKQNDIALLQLRNPVHLAFRSDLVYVNSICLPNQFDILNGTAIVSGWGYRGKNSLPSKILQKADVDTFDHDKCEKSYSDVRITNAMVCAGGKSKGSCMGDSGGPLIQIKNNRAYQVGIISFSVPCAVEGIPDVFTNVAHYRNWINMVIEQDNLRKSRSWKRFQNNPIRGIVNVVSNMLFPV